jgi:hypothetical protein
MSGGEKFPPFANAVVAAKRRGQQLNVFVHAGDQSWRRAKSRAQPHVLCCPPDADFKDFDWGCVAGLSITLVVWNRPAELVAEFAMHLVRCGAALVVALNGPNLERAPKGTARITIYKPRAVA